MAENSSFREHARRWTIVAALISLAGAGGGYLIWRSLEGGTEHASVRHEGPGFAVLLPGTPTEEIITGSGPSGPVEVPRLVLEPEGQEISYTVEYYDYPPGLLAGISALVQGRNPEWVVASGRNLAAVLGGTVASEVPLSLDGHAGNEVTIDGPEGRTTIARIYMVEDRLYRLIVTTPREQASRSEIREFLDSFELVEPSASEADPDV